MRRLAAVLLLLFLACRAVSFAPPPFPTPSAAGYPSQTPSPVLVPTSTSTPLSTPGSLPTSITASLPSDRNFSVRFHPDGPLYVGDLVSMEVIPTPGINVEISSVRVDFDVFQDAKPAVEKFGKFGIGGRSQATFQWIWNTAGFTAGEHTLTFSIQPGGPTWTETVFLSPHGQAPPPEPYARWASTESDFCLVYYINGTPVERDLSVLLEIADKQAEATIQQLGAKLSDPMTITYLPRVLGHGGFAGQVISISYLDRNYTGGDTSTILHHEMVHILDSRLGGELRPLILMEGLAVYLSGGHFKPEALMPRAAALLPPAEGCIPWTSTKTLIPSTGETIGCGLDRYIEFTSLIDNFYFEQHEAGYLEAGALVEFIVETWGWKAFSEFYRDIHTQPTVPEGMQAKHGGQYQAMNAALVAHFGVTLEQLEERFLQALYQEKLTPVHSEDVRLTVLFYDSVRRYQQLLDPSAYFLTAWLPDVEQMRKKSIVADYLRRPARVENFALESMLATANSYLLDGKYDLAAETLEAANAVMDGYPRNGNQAFAAHSLAVDYLALVKNAAAQGFTPERIQIEGETARVWVSKAGPPLSELFYVQNQEGWILIDEVETQSTNIDLFGYHSYGQFHNQPNNVSNGGSQYKSSVSN